jgi:protein-S-isoprenylcysteine O-methyltransferase Ste14
LATLRIRADAPTKRDALAETGPYVRVRHPIHSGTQLEFRGPILVHPSASMAPACAPGGV